jgi:hypothetical protein
MERRETDGWLEMDPARKRERNLCGGKRKKNTRPLFRLWEKEEDREGLEKKELSRRLASFVRPVS